MSNTETDTPQDVTDAREPGEPMIWDRPNILLSIDPEWAEAILDGSKRWEYRKAAPKRVPPLRLVLYASAPVSAAIGVAYCGQLVQMEPESLIDATVADTPHEKVDVLEYFGKAEVGNALRVDGSRRFEEPTPIDKLRDMELAPSQNFRYIGTAGIPEGWIDV